MSQGSRRPTIIGGEGGAQLPASDAPAAGPVAPAAAEPASEAAAPGKETIFLRKKNFFMDFHILIESIRGVPKCM